MKLTIIIVSIYFLITTIGAPPVGQDINKNEQKNDSKEDESDEALNNLEYSRYLKEVVEILENDPEFKKKLENASLDDIKSGNIAQHLGLVQHNVRTKLDEAKQREMARLRELVGRKIRNLSEKERMELASGNPNGKNIKDFLPQHIDHQNSDNFGQADLERLIRHASKDLDEIDRQREQQFKEYELRKEFERRTKLAEMNEEERKKQEALHQEAIEKKKHHPKVNHPGSVDQMQEVWEDVDHLEAEQFNSKSFFKLHDINSDGFLDEGEIEAIMLKEAEKIHDNTPEADPIEKQEEMDRMRQHVMKEFDKDNDRMISYVEFDYGIGAKDAKNDQGWQSLEDTTIFSDQEFQNFSEELSHRAKIDMVVHSFYVINRSGGLIFSYEHSIPKIELEKVFSYPLGFVLKQGQKGVTVEFGQRDGIKVGHTILSINGIPVRGNYIDFSTTSTTPVNNDDEQPMSTSTSHDIIEYLSNPANYPVTIKFGRTRLNGNEKLILASIFHSMYAIASQLSPELNSTGIRELETDQFKLYCFQSITGIKFIALTDTKQVNVDALLKRCYELYSDYALKNPFYSVEQPIWCSLFQETVKQAIDSLEKTGSLYA